MRCSFCQKTIEKGTGKVYVQKSGKIMSFCSTKCEKNLLKLKHKPLTTRWTEDFKKKKQGKK
jgi:large subunit ribosomal protein L24e